MIKLSPKQLPTLGRNTVIDYKKEYANKIIHSCPDCNDCIFAKVYTGDGKNIYKNEICYRIYCTQNRVPIQVPKTLENPTPYTDLWMPFTDWKLSLSFPTKYKYHIYIASCITTKEMSRCVVLQSSLPEEKWKGTRKMLINTKDESIFPEPNLILPKLY